jgi:hypothetical protein
MIPENECPCLDGFSSGRLSGLFHKGIGILNEDAFVPGGSGARDFSTGMRMSPAIAASLARV